MLESIWDINGSFGRVILDDCCDIFAVLMGGCVGDYTYDDMETVRLVAGTYIERVYSRFLRDLLGSDCNNLIPNFISPAADAA